MTLNEETVARRSDGEVAQADLEYERKPLMTTKAILLMNVGYFGVQFSGGLQQTALNPIFAFLGATPAEVPILNLAGPLTGLLIQPLIGAMSDKTWSPRFGRRRPYFLAGAFGAGIVLFLFPFVTALWMAVVLLWLLDASNNTAMEPYRALISDKLRLSQRAQGYLTQSLFIGAGTVTANLSLFVFQKLIKGATAAGIPYWVPGAFWVGAFFSVATILIAVLSTKEIPPTEAELAELRARPSGLAGMVKEIGEAVRAMPVAMHKIGLLFAFQWYALFVYWQFATFSIAESAYGVGPNDPKFQDAVGLTGLANGWYNLVTVFASLAMMPLAIKYGAKRVHAVSLLLAGVGLVIFPHVHSTHLLFLPLIGLGIAWASIVALPYVMVTSMVPKERIGVYLGIVNMMIVIPQFVETLTFGWIYEHLLGGKATNAMIFAGVMFAVAALAAMWINPPKASEESPIIPLGSPRRISSVYHRVIVGSDGTPASLVTVGHAAGVADAAEARLVVVSAYNPDPLGGLRNTATVGHRELYGETAARAAVAASVRELTRRRFKQIEQRVVAGNAAHALLEAAGPDPANLIVVGNRGLGAEPGEEIGSVAREVVKQATCNVMIVQTAATDETYIDNLRGDV